MTPVTKIHCPICMADVNPANAIMRFDDRFGYPGTFHSYRCQNCGHRFILEKFSESELQNLYTNYYPRSNFDLKQYVSYEKSNAFRTWLNGDLYLPFRWVKPNSRVLDIGCGFGQSLGYLQSIGCDAYGVEADENIRRIADEFDYKVNVGMFDPKNYNDEFFDSVTMGQVIEHISDPLQCLHDISKILKPNGIIILSTPNAGSWGAKFFGARWINWHAPYHLQLFTTHSMRILAENAGLRIDSVKTYTPSDWLLCQWLHLLTYPAPGVTSAFWSSSQHWNAGKKAVRFGLHILHKVKFNHLVSRLFDMFGIGDNKLYFLRKR